MTLRAPRFTASWLWLLLLFSLAGFVEAAFWGQMGAFTPLYLPRLGLAAQDVAAWTGLLVAISSTVGIPFLPLWGALADRYSRRPIIIRSFVAHLCAALIAAAAGNVWVYALGRAIMAFALGNSGLMMATLADRSPPARLGLTFAIFNSAAPAGAFVGPLLGGRVVDRLGFPALLVIDALLLLGVIVALTLGYTDSFRGTKRASIGRMALDSVAIVWRSPRLRLLFPALFLLMGGWMLALTYVPLAVTTLYHGADANSAVGLVMGAAGVVPLVLAPALGALADRFGHWRLLLIGAAAEVVLWPLPAFTSSLIGFGTAWAVINGIASSVFAISFSVLANAAAPEERGRVMAFAYLPANVGSIVGPALGSLITRTSVFTVFPAAALLTAAAVLGLVRASRRA